MVCVCMCDGVCVCDDGLGVMACVSKKDKVRAKECKLDWDMEAEIVCLSDCVRYGEIKYVKKNSK